ncbi:YkgJ family cysteine cluster protein [Ramlibacter albus]|uniref:YkgJ family cysteine cluster protein n=1 Tax=Ramlibacter albus TaxID=2079448 RepID=A0A923MAA5_9BURK|nr:YkgJ family cysteine cluster protein [Ramlibacter albus]MBC5766728.1 YkgJ family cysteine cluster protein [Ramlibacter albus]
MYSVRYNLQPAKPAPRQCGECVACCQALRIDSPQLQKQSGVLCPNCTGKGCGIYEQRPQVCREWLCTWMRAPEIPEDFRPDLLGVMFSYEAQSASANPFERRYFVGRYLRDPSTVDLAKVEQVIDYLARASVHVPVWLSKDGEMRLVHPRKPLADLIFQGDTASADAVAWRNALS